MHRELKGDPRVQIASRIVIAAHDLRSGFIVAVLQDGGYRAPEAYPSGRL